MEGQEVKHECIIAVDERGSAILLNSKPSLYEHDIFDGHDLGDNINHHRDRVPKKMGVYKCNIIVFAHKYWTDCGYEYDVDTWIEDLTEIELESK